LSLTILLKYVLLQIISRVLISPIICLYLPYLPLADIQLRGSLSVHTVSHPIDVAKSLVTPHFAQ
jgi:hypothetical protein